MPDPFAIEVKSSAAKYIKKQDAKTQRLIKGKLEKIAADPFDAQHSKWLANHDNKRSARVGDIRLIFEVTTAERRMTLLYADSRGQVYDRLG